MNNDKRIAIALILVSALFFSVMNLCVRLAGDIPSIQKTFFRNAVAFLCALIVLIKNHTPLRGPKGSLKYLLLRSSFGTLGIFCNFYAVDHLNISDASLLNKLSPFFAILLSVLILKEKASLRQGLCVLVAFIGLVFVVRPGFNSIEIGPYLIGMLGGFGAGTAYTFVRKLGQIKTPGPLIVLFFSGFSCLVAVPFIVFDFTVMTGMQLFWLLMAGCAASIAQFAITGAYRHAPARDISIFEYTQIIFSAVLGFLFLDQIPDLFCFIGYAIIIFAAAVNTGKSKLIK